MKQPVGLARCSCLLLLLLLAACTSDEEMDYCKNHYRFHDAHESAPSQLVINLSESGELVAVLTLPLALADSQQEPGENGGSSGAQGLENPDQVYDLHSARSCEMSDSSLIRNRDSVEHRYEYRCGMNNKLGQIDVKLFDIMPKLDEIEVSVTTPATAKHFVISRQCEQAIFRLK